MGVGTVVVVGAWAVTWAVAVVWVVVVWAVVPAVAPVSGVVCLFGWQRRECVVGHIVDGEAVVHCTARRQCDNFVGFGYSHIVGCELGSGNISMSVKITWDSLEVCGLRQVVDILQRPS